MAGRSTSVIGAAKTGDERRLLIAMRDRLARAMSEADCPARDLSPLANRLMDIAKRLAELDRRSEEDAVAPDEGYDPATD